MNQIRPLPLWIGNAGDGRAVQELFANGIRAVVQLAWEEEQFRLPRELISIRFPLLDGAGNEAELLQLVIKSVAELIQRDIPTLVACGAGMSRSPAIVAAALATLGKSTLEQSLRLVSDCRPTDISPGLWDEIGRIMPREGGE